MIFFEGQSRRNNFDNTAVENKIHTFNNRPTRPMGCYYFWDFEERTFHRDDVPSFGRIVFAAKGKNYFTAL